MDAQEQPGALTTRPFVVEGRRLVVNADANGGSLRVDLPRGEVRCERGDLAAVQGQTVTLRFTLTGTSLYSFWLQS
jgi:hypothetical protein